MIASLVELYRQSLSKYRARFAFRPQGFLISTHLVRNQIRRRIRLLKCKDTDRLRQEKMNEKTKIKDIVNAARSAIASADAEAFDAVVANGFYPDSSLLPSTESWLVFAASGGKPAIDLLLSRFPLLASFPVPIRNLIGSEILLSAPDERVEEIVSLVDDLRRYSHDESLVEQSLRLLPTLNRDKSLLALSILCRRAAVPQKSKSDFSKEDAFSLAKSLSSFSNASFDRLEFVVKSFERIGGVPATVRGAIARHATSIAKVSRRFELIERLVFDDDSKRALFRLAPAVRSELPFDGYSEMGKCFLSCVHQNISARIESPTPIPSVFKGIIPLLAGANCAFYSGEDGAGFPFFSVSGRILVESPEYAAWMNAKTINYGVSLSKAAASCIELSRHIVNEEEARRWREVASSYYSGQEAPERKTAVEVVFDIHPAALLLAFHNGEPSYDELEAVLSKSPPARLSDILRQAENFFGCKPRNEVARKLRALKEYETLSETCSDEIRPSSRPRL